MSGANNPQNNLEMKYIIVDDGDIYALPNSVAELIKKEYDTLSVNDGDLSNIIKCVKEYGNLLGSVFAVIRN